MKKILFISVIFIGSLYSATFNVSTTPELRTALSASATNGEDDTIILANGTYKTTDDGLGTFIYLSNEANSLTLQGSSADNVILSGDNQHQILNHQSTQNAILILENLTFTLGKNSDGNGGAVFTDFSIQVQDCNFTNNIASKGSGFYLSPNSSFTTDVNNSSFLNNSASGDGGGFYAYANVYSYININNSSFKNNTAINGGGFYAYSYPSTIINNSLFEDNSVTGNGGGFISRDIEISNSIFRTNNATSGGGVYAKMLNSKTVIKNSIFDNNNATSGGGVYAITTSYWNDKATIVNSIFVNNSNNFYFMYGEQHQINNSIFYNNSNYDISGNNEAVVNLNYNYIDESLLTISNFKTNNIYSGASLGFVDEASEDYNLTVSSDLIDAGTTTVDGITFPTTDLNGNTRIVGGNIDIGPYEFSTTRPTINSFTFTGIAKEFTELTFNATYTLTLDGRTIQSIEYDYLNDGTWTTMNTHTFNSAGTYIVNVNVTDSLGEFSTKDLTITISAITLEDKLSKYLTQEQIDELLPSIQSDINSSFNSGKQFVLDHTDQFDLVYDTNNISVSQSDIDALPEGWSLLGSPSQITDLSIFDNVKIVWTLDETTQQWSSYSPELATQTDLNNSNTINTLHTIPAKRGFWIKK